MVKRNTLLLIKYIILVFIAISMIFPFVVMISIAITNNDGMFATSNIFSNNKLTLCNFKHVFTQIPITRYFLNSLIVATLTTVGQVIISALAGYAFAKLKFKYKNALFLLILITMMVPPQVNIIPLFFLMRELHLVNTYSALILPGLFGGFGVFFMRQYFLSLPKDIIDASVIDGCNAFQTFFKIIFPLSLPAIITLSVFTFITTWNSFIWGHRGRAPCRRSP